MEFITGISSFLLSFAAEISKDWQAAIPQLNVIAKLVQWLHSWVGDYGWAVIIFTVFLKVITLPADIWQKVSTKKNAEKMKAMQKQLDKLDKQYANDQRRLNDEKQKLYKKQGYSAFSSCLPMIITIAIFMIMFTGLNSYSAYINVRNYAWLEAVYLEAAEDSLGGKTQSEATEEEKAAAIEAGKEAVKLFYNGELSVYDQEGNPVKVKESFLWIKNIWRPDTWENIMADAGKFQSGGTGLKAVTNDNFDPQLYNTIRNAVLEADPGYFAKYNDDGSLALNSDGTPQRSGWNGLLVLPIVAMGLAFLSSLIAQKQNKGVSASDPSQQSQKTMMFIMPIMSGVFGFIYTSAFAVYLVSNSLLTLVATLLTNAPINKAVEKSVSQEEDKSKASYMR